MISQSSEQVLQGARLQEFLGRDFKVVVEKRDVLSNTIEQEKCCGGLLAPDAQKMLAKLSLGLPTHILSGPQLFCVRAIDLDNAIERFYQISIHGSFKRRTAWYWAAH
jgi:hypothetical protein